MGRVMEQNKVCSGCNAMKIVGELEVKTKAIIDVGMKTTRTLTAKECAAIADELSMTFKPGSWDQQACLKVSKAIREKFGLEI